jgi:ParB family chromosome partitioning protein
MGLIDRGKRDLKYVAVEKIYKNKNNPRRSGAFTEENLAPLKASIEEHGVLQPVVVAHYDDDIFELIDGERRWTTAQLLGMKEVPALIVNSMDDHDEVVTMFHIHTQHKAWKMAEELRAIGELLSENGHRSHTEMAKELGMSLATFQGRLKVLALGEDVIRKIAQDKLDYTAALRTTEAVATIAKSRPKVTKQLGGEEKVQRKLLEKAEARKGIGPELVEIKPDLGDVKSISDKRVKDYIEKPSATKRDLRGGVEEKRKVETLTDRLRRLRMDLRQAGSVDLKEAGDLTKLRLELTALIEEAQKVESKVITALTA